MAELGDVVERQIGVLWHTDVLIIFAFDVCMKRCLKTVINRCVKTVMKTCVKTSVKISKRKTHAVMKSRWISHEKNACVFYAYLREKKHAKNSRIRHDAVHFFHDVVMTPGGIFLTGV